MPDEPQNTESLLLKAAAGDLTAWGALLAAHQEQLARIAAFRIDPRLRGRLDPADVVQEGFIVATERRAAFFEQSESRCPSGLLLWLRWIMGNTLLELHRHHLSVRMRDARREVTSARRSDFSGSGDDHTRVALVAHLTCGLTGPATAVGRAELKERVDEAIGEMDPMDREVLALRHYEQLTNGEAAQVLGIQERAAAKRYLRALERLREAMSDIAGDVTGLQP